MTTINNQVITDANRLDTVSKQIGRERVAFEVSINKTRHVASGIYVTVKHTDVARQRVDGWMQLADEGRILWIRGLGLQETFPFATRASRDGESAAQAPRLPEAQGRGQVPRPDREARPTQITFPGAAVMTLAVW